jgi:hypothetical protein
VVKLIFAIFYKHALGLPVIDSIFQATLVLGTAGYPDVCGVAQLIVVLQIFLDLIIVLLLLSAFAGEVGLFNRTE